MSKQVTICLCTGIGNTIMVLPVAQALETIGYKVKFLIHPDPYNKILPAVIDGYEYTFGTKTTGLIAIPTLWNSCVHRAPGTKVGDKEIIVARPDYTKTHETEGNMEIAYKLGYKGPTPLPIIRNVTPCLNDTIVIATEYKPGGLWSKKGYPHWPELCRKLRKKGYKLSFVGVKCPKWIDKSDDNRCGLSLKEAINWIAGSKAVVSIDNGIAHVAAALGKKTNVIFGPTLVTKNRPLGLRVNVINSGKCKPCQLTPRWDACKNFVCTDMSPEYVLSRLQF